MIRRLKRAQRLILLIEDSLIVCLLSAMILLAAGQIVLRNLFDTGLFWADPALRMLVLWLTLLGAIAATREDRHIRIDLLSRFLHARGKTVVQGINDLFSAFVCGLISWHAARFVYHEWQDGVSLFGGLPAWLGEIIIPIGFGIMALRFLANLLLRLLRDPNPC
jgi:TRAP-type C4-dicarboxylate transport system permease small subunit